MKFSLVAVSACLFGLALSAAVPYDKNDIAVSSLLREVDRAAPDDPSSSGYIELGEDGVLRKMDSKHDVAAYKQLSPDEIDVMLRAWPNKAEREHLMELYRGVDGRTVTNEKVLLHPGFLADRQRDKAAVEVIKQQATRQKASNLPSSEELPTELDLGDLKFDDFGPLFGLEDRRI
ncbi:hypothetical protein VTN00DRAFT_8954 [Thermoascus crustaceus]|uniref:uncharacterized protein n=1 Tax=Thermoascus crustaceus TaxID=5088 RepID=UPI00374479CC